jgi:putative ABC transport system permease protein
VSFLAPWRRNRRLLSWWVMVCLLGVSIGSSVAVVVAFSHAVLKPLPGPNPERLVSLGGLAFGAGIPDPIAWWQTDGLEHLARYTTGDIKFGADAMSPRWIRLTVVSGGFFEMFGQWPLTGRTLMRVDEVESRRVIVLREDLWRRVRAPGQGIEDVQVRLNGEAYAVIGVVPHSFSFPSESQAWIPQVRVNLGMGVALAEGIGGLPPVRNGMGWVGRLRPEASVAQVEEQLTARLQAANATLSPKTGVRYGGIVQVSSLQDRLSGSVRPQLTVMLFSTAVILLLALANCVLYSLTVGVDRRGEVALKLSLGASRSAIWAEQVAEAIAMSAICLGGSVLTAWLMINVSRWLLFAYRVYIPPFEVVLPAVFGLSAIVCAIVSGLVSVPSVLVARSVSLTSVLNGVSGRVPSRRRLWVRRVFVAGTGAISTLLVAGALTANFAFTKAMRRPLGHESRRVVAGRLVYPLAAVAGDRFAVKRAEVLAAVRSAGVQAAIAGVVPITASDRKFQMVGSRGARTMAAITSIDGDFFRVMEIPIVAGQPQHVSGGDVVVNRSLAVHLWGDAGAAPGQSISIAAAEEQWTVIAVAEDSRTVDQEDRRVYEVYRPFTPPDGGMVAVEVLAACRVSCAGEFTTIIDAIRRVPGGQLARADTVASLEWDARAGSIVSATVWSVFALLAAVLAVVGSATLAAHSIARRRIEIGVRGALGASPSLLTWMLTKGSLLSLAAGAVVGLGVARQLVKVVESTTTVVQPPGSLVLLLSGVVVTAGGTLAAFFVARRASRANVAVSLRTN